MSKRKSNSVELYKAYVQVLESEGKAFPANQHGGVNLSKVADECGFLRQVFHQNKTIAALLDEDARRIGTEIHKPNKTDEYLTEKISDAEKAVGQLRKSNSRLSEENDALRKQIMELETVNIRLKNAKKEGEESLEHMIQTGRRFTL